MVECRNGRRTGTRVRHIRNERHLRRRMTRRRRHLLVHRRRRRYRRGEYRQRRRLSRPKRFCGIRRFLSRHRPLRVLKKIPRGSRGIFCATIFVRRALPFTRRRIGTRRGPLRLSLTRRTRISRKIPTLCLTKRPETPLRQQRRTRKPRRNRAYAPPASEGIRGSRR